MTRHHDRAPRRRARLFAAALALSALSALGALGGAALAADPAASAAKPEGHDVSGHQKDVDWRAAKEKGAAFVYVKATESHTYRNPYFARQYNGSRDAGMVRGAYHFALPDRSSGARQAAYFVAGGGGWRADGWTLPPALDLENDPYSKRKCYGLPPTALTGWIDDFSDEVHRLTGRRPVIYTTAKWWDDCTGGSRVFAREHPLWLARWAGSPGALPAGWSFWTFWQYADGSGRLPGDQNLFNGSPEQLRAFTRE
ncbi:lysozyme [Streptomyces sp. NPDC050504]|uniref:lysozyme n=1 Tax=Streptomyces sp. NPDC050504 TaxID=3365618 RepID=UPI0037AC0DAB